MAKEKEYPLIPFGEKILVQRRTMKTETAGGIVLPDSYTEQKINEGTVLAHGTGGTDANGKEIVFNTSVGDEILFDEYAGHEVLRGDEHFLLLPESSIVCIIRV